jgi:hypothetical protein
MTGYKSGLTVRSEEKHGKSARNISVATEIRSRHPPRQDLLVITVKACSYVGLVFCTHENRFLDYPELNVPG